MSSSWRTAASSSSITRSTDEKPRRPREEIPLYEPTLLPLQQHHHRQALRLRLDRQVPALGQAQNGGMMDTAWAILIAFLILLPFIYLFLWRMK
jgi:hypothetical protein